MFSKGDSRGLSEELKEETEDKFIAMVSARAETDLRLADFAPRSSLVVPAHDVQRAKFPVIDFHNHLDAQEPERPECLAQVSGWLEEHPNLSVDISARASELGRQPFTAREFFLRHADRILFGTDLVPEEEMYRLYFRFLETADEYFDYPSHASRQGRWQVYGLHLPDEVLRRVYRDNARRLLCG